MEVICWYFQVVKFNNVYKSFVRVIVESKTSGTTQTLSKAPVGTVYNKVYGNNIDDDSYSESVYEGIQRLLQEPSTTLWAQDTYVFSSQEYIDCQVFLMESSRLSYSYFPQTCFRLKKFGKNLLAPCHLPSQKICPISNSSKKQLSKCFETDNFFD